MKEIKKYQIIAFTILIISGCSKENIKPDFVDIPVVEGYLHAGQPIEIKVSRQVPYSNDAIFSSENLDSLSINIFDGNLNYELLSVGEGKYTNINLNINQLNSFRLDFFYNDLPIVSETTVPKKPENFLSSRNNIYVSDDIFTTNEPSEIEFSWENSDDSYYFILIENIELNPTPIFENDNLSNINKLFKITPTLSDSYSMNTRRFSYYGNHRIILFHINSDLAALYEESDNTSQNISNPSSEINNAFGIFTGINSDTLYLQVEPQ